ncbi:DUF4350 domain-containing protein [Microbulbifer sp. VAAF005]|uniref:DUF4350 domain-containing protein n=1 Tax=Microbulbifer sp. VAAF005 TaxID=3034230 RepID=UPI0024AD17FA|nr:DUF4350 domain-containing protein [Microbulbifer sp. VAAF005]WHI45138.1 DUF4350 domain-containing protein [Microbulbifer sp. VAAF005]
MTAKRILLAALVISGVALVWLFLTFYERYSKEIDSGWSMEARRNPYLAAERYLTNIQLTPRQADNISVLQGLTPDATLFISSSSQVYNPTKAQELIEWVQRGGHAIVVAYTGNFDSDTGRSENRDWLLESMNVSLRKGHSDFELQETLEQLFGEDAVLEPEQSPADAMREHNRNLDKGETEEGSEKQEEPRNPDVSEENLVTLPVEGGSEIQLYLNASHLLYHPSFNDETITDGPVFWAKVWRDDVGVPFMQFERGNGVITLMTDSTLWQSQRIGHFDHAYFLQLLAGEGEFVFLTRPRFESLPKVARQYAAEFFIAGALALLAWLLLHGRRFGPLQPEPEVSRRSLLEHISACGHYYWQDDQCEALLRGHREEILRQLGATHINAGKKRKLCDKLCASTGMDEQQLVETLWGKPPTTEETFTEHMRNLQRIEAVL